jgi:hypothetical protein
MYKVKIDTELINYLYYMIQNSFLKYIKDD